MPNERSATAPAPRWALVLTLAMAVLSAASGCGGGGETTAQSRDDNSATTAPRVDASTGAPGSPDDPQWPPYASTVEPVTAERLGASWRPGCPVDPVDLRLVRVVYAGPSGAETGELIVAASAAEDVAAVFADLYAARFPINRIATVDTYRGDDDASMAADNTSAFNCRPVTGGEGWSRHAYGLAIDVNPLVNPYVDGDTILPPAGRLYLDRADVRPGMIVAGDAVVAAFAARGFTWGGDFSTIKDYQHFAPD